MRKYIRYEEENYYFEPKTEQKRLFPSLSAQSTIYLSVIIPAKDEQYRLPKMVEECLEYLSTRSNSAVDFTWEVIVVDDGSTDETTNVALKYCAQFSTEKVRVLTLKENRGKGGAVRLGMLSARGKYLLFADADGATRFSDFEKLESELKKLQEGAADDRALTVGSRAHLEKDSIAQRSVFRTFLMLGFHFLVWLFAVRTVNDTQCGFKLFTRKAARVLFGNLHVERWAFDVELLFLAETLKIPIKEVAVNWQEIEGSKLTPLAASVQMGRDLLTIWFLYFSGKWKIEEKPKID